jgi:thiol-disulfide isomerase/thioredoxin
MKRLALTTILLLTLTSLLISQEARTDSKKEIELFTTMDNAMMKAKTEPVVLFFYASWCPSCRAAKSDIESNLDKLEGITLLLVDYDKSADLKRKYGVTYQDTYVQIDSDGKKITLWNGGKTNELLKNVIRKERL